MSHDELISMGFSFDNLIGLYYQMSIENEVTGQVLYLSCTNLGHSQHYTYSILPKGSDYSSIGVDPITESDFREIIRIFKSDILDNKINNLLC